MNKAKKKRKIDFRDFEKTIKAISYSAHIPNMEADDIAQELRIATWKASKKYDPQKGSPQTFFNRIAKNTLINLYRRSQAKRRQIDAKTLSFESLTNNQRAQIIKYLS